LVGFKGNWGELLIREPGLTIISTRSSDSVFESILRSLQDDHAEKQCKAIKLDRGILALASGFNRGFKSCLETKLNEKLAGGTASSGLIGITTLMGAKPQ
jgi:hypothetical protein